MNYTLTTDNLDGIPLLIVV